MAQTNGSEAWHQDPDTGLWYKNNDLTQPYANDYSKIPFSAEEIVAAARELAVRVGTACLVSHGQDGFPHPRLVSPGKHIAADLSEVSVATRLFTRKVEEIKANSKASLFWQDRRSERSSAWVSVQGVARVEPEQGVNPEQKGKVYLTVERVEMQDYDANITGHGWDTWKPAIVERRNGNWIKTQ